MIESILLATDGSDAALVAERYAVALAARLRARLHGVTVVEEGPLQGLRSGSLGVPQPNLDEIEAYLKARAEAVCRRVSELSRSQGVECNPETLRGAADDRIVERGQGFDLVVLGRDGEHQSTRTALIGSTVDGVLRKTTKPTVVVPHTGEFGGPVVLGFDGSPGSRIAAKIGVELAGRLEQPIHVFVDSKDKGRAAARFEEVRRLLGSASVPVRENSSTLGRPDVKLVDTARSARAGLIVMGAFGRNRISEYFLGSNAAAVVRTSPVAVLLAR
ncbi:MAG: universal stress protein [Myxococcota bacterium]|nr:universal stress protein [Myxococcota bacterium]